jgi:hypothetical protein
MLRLTQQEQKVLIVLVFLLLLGLAVKSWKTAHPPPPAANHLTGKHARPEFR